MSRQVEKFTSFQSSRADGSVSIRGTIDCGTTLEGRNELSGACQKTRYLVLAVTADITRIFTNLKELIE